MARPSGRVKVQVVQNGTAKAIRLTKDQTTQLVAAQTAAVEAAAKVNLQTMVYDLPDDPRNPRTGNLMNSTGSEVEGDQGQVFSSAEYAVHVHEGTTRMTGREYLVQALTDQAKELPARARRISNGELS